MKKLLLFISIIGLLTKLNAAYYSSGFITYKYLSGNKFRIIFQATQDCRALDLGSTMQLNVRDNINTTHSAFLTMSRSGIKEISWNNNGVCSSKNFGVKLHTYEYTMDLDTILNGVLKTVCKIYMSAEFCCRNGSINTYAPGNGYVTCMMDRCQVQTNSGPDVQNLHMSYFFINNSCYFNPIAMDTLDKDFIEFELVAPLNGFKSDETYSNPYTARYPITPFCTQSGQLNCNELPLSSPPRGLYFDSLNGNLIFTPTKNSEVGSLVYKAKEYRYINGVRKLIGYYYIDNYFVTNSSGFYNPVITKSTLKLNHYFTAGKTGIIQLSTQLNDTAKQDSVILTCYNPIRGSSVSITKKWRPDLTFSWQPKCEDIRKEPYVFYLEFISENKLAINPQHIAFNVFVSSDLDLGNDTVICKNSTFAIESNINGKFKWNNTSGDTFKIYTANKSGTYYLQVERNGCIVYDSIKLREISNIPDVNLGNDTVICDKAPQSIITVAAPFDPYVKYKWNKDTGRTYSFIDFRDTGWVSVKGTNVCGTSIDSIHISRNSTPKMNLPSDTLICDKLSWIIRSEVSGNGSFLWDDRSIDSFRIVSSNGTYTLKYRNICGTVNDSVHVEFKRTPEFYLPADTVICNSQYPRFDFSQIDASFLWSDGKTGKVFNSFKSGILWVQASNECGTKRDTTVISNQSFPYIKPLRDTFICKPFTLVQYPSCNACSYIWNGQFNTQKLIIQDAGTYTLLAGNACGNIKDTFVVLADSFPYFRLPADTNLKRPFNLIITPDKYFKNKVWSNGDTTMFLSVNTPGKYWMMQSNACGTFTDTMIVSVNSKISEMEYSDFSIYPNPVNKLLQINCEIEVNSIRIIDLHGRISNVNFEKSGSVILIDTSDLSEGIYQLEITVYSDKIYRPVQVIH